MYSDEGDCGESKDLEAAWRQAYALLEARLAVLEHAEAAMRSRLAAREAYPPEPHSVLDAIFAPDGRRN